MGKFHNVEQNSEEWFELRLGKATSSNFNKIMVWHDKGKWGVWAITYAKKVALERITGKRDETKSFTSADMERGHTYEPVAIILYEKEKFTEVKEGGFYSMGKAGDSPDGLVWERGCVEVKTRIPNTFWDRIEKGGVDSSYSWQVQGHLLIGDKDWCDFIDFCPEFPEEKQLLVYRINRDEEIISKLEKRLTEFEGLIQKYINLIK